MFKRLTIITAMAVSIFCISDAAEAQFGGVQVQVGGYGSGIRVGSYGYGNGLYSGTGYGGYGYGGTGYGGSGYGNRYSNFYGQGNGYGGPSLNYRGVYSNNTNVFRGYPSAVYRTSAPRYYASPVRRFTRRFR